MSQLKKFLFITCFLISVIGNAAVEQFTNSLSGSLNKPLHDGGFIQVKDQWLPYMLTNPAGSGTPYTNIFYLSKSSTKVILRYDDTKRRYSTKQWNLEVTYSIDLFDATGGTTTVTGEKLNINYDPSEGVSYTDINQKKYDNYLGARLTITCVKFFECNTTGSPSPCNLTTVICDFSEQPIPDDLSDIYLDVVQETERFYNLNESDAPEILFQDGFTSTDPLPENTLPLVWSYKDGAESYDLEWLFIDAPDTSTSGTIDLTTLSLDFDFRDATRVNVSTNTYNIPMTFPSGILLYRVRARGYEVITSPSLSYQEIETEWSEYNAITGNTSSYSTDESRRYNFSGVKTKMNWSYTVSFAEDGKRSEGISFMDGTGKTRQSVGLINSDGTAIVSEIKYDYEGRGVSNIMPVPLTSDGITYYNNFAPGFDKTNFDEDVNIMNPDPLGSTDKANVFYGNDVASTGVNSYIPDANGYAYNRVRYKVDGTGRIDMASGVGPDLKMGSGHETRYYYSSPSTQTEVDRMFGNEVGNWSHYQKNMLQDPNGQISLSYLDQEGRTVATCIAGYNPANLLAVDLRPDAPDSETDDLLTGKDNYTSSGELELSTDILVSQTDTFSFVYNLNSTSACDDCMSTSESCSPSIDDSTGCRDCLYDIDIAITDDYGNPVTVYVSYSTDTSCVAVGDSVASISCSGLNSVTFNFLAALNIGNYHLVKVLKVHEQDQDSLKAEYMAFQNLTHRCVQVPLLNPGTCAPDCNTACTNSYRILLSNGVYAYINDAGEPITASEADSLIGLCQTACNGPDQLDPECTDCDCKLRTLKADMSPGGQYFDNAYSHYQLNDDGTLTVDTTYYSTGINAWLSSNTSISSLNSIISAYASNLSPSDPNYGYTASFSSFDDLRSNWQSWFADTLYTLHPEYDFYYTFCKRNVCSHSIATINEFEDLIYSLDGDTAWAQGYFNFFAYPLDTTYSVSDLTAGNNTYNSTSEHAIDPMYQPCDGGTALIVPCADGCYSGYTCSPKTYIGDKMKNFFQISSGNYVSIWYAMDDPLNIHLATDSAGSWYLPTPNHTTTVDSGVVRFFQMLHGDGGSEVGIITDMDSKYGFFLSQYNFYRKALLYLNAKYLLSTHAPPFPLTDAGGGFTVAEGSSFPKDQRHYAIRFKGVDLFDMADSNLCNPAQGFVNLDTLTNHVDTTLTSQCQTGCESYASQWIATIKDCITTLSDTTTIKSLLVELCTKTCVNDGETPVGSDGCHDTVNCNQSAETYVTYMGNNYYTFDEIIAVFGCDSIHLEHPLPVDDPIDCACRNFHNFDLAQYTPGSPATALSDADLAAILTANLDNGTTYTSTDISNFRSFCSSSLQIFAPDATLPTNFPTELECPTNEITYDAGTCSCENLDYFITSFGFDPDSVHLMDSTDLAVQILASHLNSALGYGGCDSITVDSTHFAQPITAGDFAAWLQLCNASHPNTDSLSNIYGFPQLFQCPTYEDLDNDTAATLNLAECTQSHLQAAINYSSQTYFEILGDSADHYVSNMESRCLDMSTSQKQTFTMTFVNYQFMYTLYYYDQAGNLIKTVPPEGFRPITDSLSLDSVARYRAGTNSIPVFPDHKLITDYKYNTLNQVIQETSPDGGRADKWYDKLGRLVVSQNQKQLVTSGGSSNNAPYNSFPYQSYSFTKYDSLGRVIQVGECQNSVALTFTIAADKDHVTSFNDWWDNVDTGSYRQVTNTFYDDEAFSTTPPGGSSGWQENLRNRIVSVTYNENSAVRTSYHTATHYSYDIHGNVKGLLNENTFMPSGNQLKYTQYDYDLVSGNVNAVYYQKDQDDQFSHNYYYDADNRLTEAYSSHDGDIWKKEAKYYYYPHGPLARVEIGDKQVAGTDYAYTLQGWIKGVNSNYLNNEFDMGNDGARNVGTAFYNNLNGNFANDAGGYTLGYFTGDYTAKNSALPNYFETSENYGTNDFTTFLTGASNSFTVAAVGYSNVSASLYNGNISRMVTALKKYDQSDMTTLGRIYFYDQLNRLKYATDFDIAAPSSGTVTATHNNNFEEGFTYDFNGNIKYASRYGLNTSGTRLLMDEITYNYNYSSGDLLNNKLDYVDDAASANDAAFADDINSGQSTGNYAYDDIGNLVANAEDEIGSIEWTVYGKVQKVIRSTINALKSDLEYIYDPMGRRMAKIEKPGGSTNTNDWIYTFYERDAQGNLLSVYEKTHSGENDVLSLKEQYIFGSSQLGSYRPDIDLLTYSAPATQSNTVAQKQYQFSNHLGNVLQTVSDKKLPVAGTGFYEEEYFTGTVNNTADQAYEGTTSDLIYTPSPPAYTTTTFSGGFSGKKMELGDDFVATVYSKTGGGSNLGQIVISVVDATGQQIDWHSYSLTNGGSGWSLDTYSVTISSFNAIPMSYTPTPPYYANCFVWNPSSSYLYVDKLTFEIDHNGSLTELAAYNADVIQTTDYYSFGSPMPGKSFNDDQYRYGGAGGQEKDIELASGIYTAEFWEYDSRIGRRWNVDPITYPWQSPYATFNNNPIYFVDPSGLSAGSGDDKKSSPLDRPNDYKKGQVYVRTVEDGERYSSQWILREDEKGNKTWEGAGMGYNLDEVAIFSKTEERKALPPASPSSAATYARTASYTPGYTPPVEGVSEWVKFGKSIDRFCYGHSFDGNTGKEDHTNWYGMQYYNSGTLGQDVHVFNSAIYGGYVTPENDILPGATAGSIGGVIKTPTNPNSYYGATIEGLENFNRWFSINNNFTGNVINALETDQTPNYFDKTAIQRVTTDTVYKKIYDGKGGSYWQYTIRENGVPKQTRGYTHGPGEHY